MKRLLFLCIGLFFFSVGTVLADSNSLDPELNLVWSAIYDPITEVLTITGDVDLVTLYDSDGNILLVTSAREIDMSIYPKGSYVLDGGRVEGEIAINTDPD